METNDAQQTQASLPEFLPTDAQAPIPAAAQTATETDAQPNPEPTAPQAEASRDAGDPADATPDGTSESGESADDPLVPNRKRIEEQLEALKSREAELRRELAIADHPQLAEAIRQLEACAYSVARADTKLAEGLSKSESRRRDTLAKKIASLAEKRDKLDAQIAELEQELVGLGEERIETFRAERRTAMERLIASLGSHTAALRDADLEAADLLPQIAPWMSEIREMAESLAQG